MSFLISMLLNAETKQAKAELDSTGKAVGRLGDATEKTGKKGRTAASNTKKLGKASKEAAGDTRELSAAEHEAAVAAARLGGANKLAAGNVGNLTAQFNDIGTMLAAGQSPLQLALQQGTQITQVIGPMGATGAVRALGAAFVQMLNPVSLITIGSIAAGAAMVGWLRDAWPEAVSLDDAMEELESGIADYARAVKAAHAPTDELKEKFGEAATEAKAVLADLAEASFRDRRKEIAATFKGISDEIGLAYKRFDQADRRRILADQFDLSSNSQKNRSFIDSVIQDIADFDKAANTANLPIKDQIAAIDKLITSYRTAAEASGDVSDKEASQLQTLQRIQIGLFELQEQRKNATNKADEKALETSRNLLNELGNQVVLQAAIAAHGRDSAEVANLRLAQERAIYEQKVKELPLAAQLMAEWDKANPRRDPYQERINSAYRYYAQTRQQSNEALQSANATVAVLNEEATVQRAIQLYGKNSVQAADARWAAEERVLRTQLESRGITGVIQDNVVAATRSTHDAESATAAWADAMSGVRAEIAAIMSDIAQLGGGMVSNAAKFVELEALQAGKNVKAAAQEARDFLRETEIKSRDIGANWFEKQILNPWKASIDRGADALADDLDSAREEARLRDRKARGGGRQSEKEAESIAKLIRREMDEIAILRTYDPVQKELLKNRKALSGATDEERKAVETLIAQRIQEQIRVDALQESYDFWGQTTLGIFDDLFVKGKSLNDVIGNLASSLASAAWQATILGTGPLASMFGTAGSGGLFGSLFGGLFGRKGFAEGGLIHGPGGPTDDRVLTFTSPGEYVVRSAQTSRYLPLLEAINSGSLDRASGFASGGMIGGIPLPMLMTRPPMLNAGGSRGGGSERNGGLIQVELMLSDDLDGRIVKQSEGVAVRVVRSGLEQFSSESLPVRFKQIAGDERAVG